MTGAPKRGAECPSLGSFSSGTAFCASPWVDLPVVGHCHRHLPQLPRYPRSMPLLTAPSCGLCPCELCLTADWLTGLRCQCSSEDETPSVYTAGLQKPALTHQHICISRYVRSVIVLCWAPRGRRKEGKKQSGCPPGTENLSAEDRY